MKNNLVKKQRDIVSPGNTTDILPNNANNTNTKNTTNNEPFYEMKMEEIRNEMRDYIKGEFEKKKDEFVIDIADTVKHEIDDGKESESKDLDASELNTRKQLRTEIITEYIYPDDKETIKSLLDNRKFYAKLLQYIRIFKLFFSAVIVPGLLLSDTQFPGKYLNYAAGIASFLVACFELGDRMIVESNKKRAEKINIVLDSLGIKYRVPDTTIDDPLNVNNNSSPDSNKRQFNPKNSNNTRIVVPRDDTGATS